MIIEQGTTGLVLGGGGIVKGYLMKFGGGALFK